MELLGPSQKFYLCDCCEFDMINPVKATKRIQFKSGDCMSLCDNCFSDLKQLLVGEGK